jgi:divalent metal cation (Fe/Co/Zn/Cd) transporter
MIGELICGDTISRVHSTTPLLIEITTMKSLYKIAFGLAVLTIVCSSAEAIFSTFYGYEDQSLTLFGFGADSLIEVISGLGIAHMILRIQRQPDSNRNNFERTALLITGSAFYVLVIGLVTTSIYNLWIGHRPTTAMPGVVIAVISIAVMWALVYGKTKVGSDLKSDAILADAACTRVCIYMSVVLLVASGIYELTKVAYVDSIGTFGLAYFSLKEGQECFAKAKSNKLCTCEGSSS